ncbi:MAG: PIN domain-containing protein [Longimicrobiales bacterium]|nr:PIN domain-containing protein [Longimicrobiales bacterium]
MSRYCLGTSAYSRFQHGDPRIVEILDSAEWVGMPAVTLGELRTGFLLGDRRDRNEADLREFLASPVVETLVIDEEVSRHYAEIVGDLRRAGTPLPTNDIWIAATAARAGAPVLTSDGHFAKIARVGSLTPGG